MVYWDTGKKFLMTSDKLYELGIDTMSWIRFFGLLRGQRDYVEMTYYPRGKTPQTLYVVPVEHDRHDLTYEKLKRDGLTQHALT